MSCDFSPKSQVPAARRPPFSPSATPPKPKTTGRDPRHPRSIISHHRPPVYRPHLYPSVRRRRQARRRHSVVFLVLPDPPPSLLLSGSITPPLLFSPMRQRPAASGNSPTDMYGNLESGRGGGPRSGGLGGGGSARDANSSILERQNDDRISELSDQVARLKGLTIDIGNEVREQNSLLDNMGDSFGNVGDMLTGSLARMGIMLERGGAKHMCYLVGFVVGVMVLLYWLVR
ncbi:hypothetical protein ACHAWF_014620 [Thalassiosira exigua]